MENLRDRFLNGELDDEIREWLIGTWPQMLNRYEMLDIAGVAIDEQVGAWAKLFPEELSKSQRSRRDYSIDQFRQELERKYTCEGGGSLKIRLASERLRAELRTNGPLRRALLNRIEVRRALQRKIKTVARVKQKSKYANLTVRHGPRKGETAKARKGAGGRAAACERARREHG